MRTLWRKQILPLGGHGNHIFTPTLLAALVASHYKDIPVYEEFVQETYNLAGDRITIAYGHERLERPRGHITELVLTPHGLDAIMELSSEGVRRIIDGFDVSVRYTYSALDPEGAMEHLLLTRTPKVEGLGSFHYDLDKSKPGSGDFNTDEYRLYTLGLEIAEMYKEGVYA